MSKTKLTKILEKELWRATRKLGTLAVLRSLLGGLGKSELII